MLLVLLKINVGSTILYLFVGVLCMYVGIRRLRKDKRQNKNLLLNMTNPTEDLATESTSSLSDEVSNDETTQTESVEKIEYGPGDYHVDPKDKNLFMSHLQNELTMRVILNSSSKDWLSISFSFPHNFTNDSLNQILGSCIGVNKVTIGDKYSIEVEKSSARKWLGLEDTILKLLFRYMYNTYNYIHEKQGIKVVLDHKNRCTFYWRLETKNHLDFGRALYAIHGIEQDIVESYPLCMNHEGNYNFSLGKAEMFSWEELFPEIEKVMQHYFPSGVNLTGYVPTKQVLA